jgi:hypothetical protein
MRCLSSIEHSPPSAAIGNLGQLCTFPYTQQPEGVL